MSIAVVIVAAGRGERAGSPEQGPKQYRLIGAEPVLRRTLRAFLQWKKAEFLITVIHRDDELLFAQALEGLCGAERIIKVFGGATRQESVLLGLRALGPLQPDHVMIHDAARPFIDARLLDGIAERLFAGNDAVLPATAVVDTLKRASPEGLVQDTVSRTNLFAAQTPQSFRFATILKAHEKAASVGRFDFTDDAAIAEWDGVAVIIAPGTSENTKLTTAQDIAMADAKYSGSPLPDVRTGNGYDVHQLVPGDGVTLCGVFIPHELKLHGHSDADVALHALTDALLATCGAGDIGDHFPPSDPQWKGAASRIFLAHAAEIVRAKGGIITNADVSLIAEVPKIAPHRDAMRAILAEVLGISIDRCSVKATTNEKIGFIGRKEGIAAIATATVVYGTLPQ